MKIKQEWIDEIVDKIFNMNPFDFDFEKTPTKEDLFQEIETWIFSPFNAKWEIPVGVDDYFKEFFINITLAQLNPYMHPLTCGVDSNHKDLFPRITYTKECLLVCADCGYVQKFNTNYLFGKE